jgi:hypothetical protein
VKGRLLAGSISPTVIRVLKKINKAADFIIVKSQLSTELLAANNAKRKEEENEMKCQIRLFKSMESSTAIKRVGR